MSIDDELRKIRDAEANRRAHEDWRKQFGLDQHSAQHDVHNVAPELYNLVDDFLARVRPDRFSEAWILPCPPTGERNILITEPPKLRAPNLPTGPYRPSRRQARRAEKDCRDERAAIIETLNRKSERVRTVHLYVPSFGTGDWGMREQQGSLVDAWIIADGRRVARYLPQADKLAQYMASWLS
jgi:hypothetical protein